MTAIAEDRMLDIVREKVEAGVRLDLEDGLALLESDDLLALGELADLARRVRGGDDCVYFVQNIYLNQTNVCRVKCKFCAFAATQKQEQAYTISPDDLVADARAEHERLGFTEIHMVNGESPHVGFDMYVETIGKLHDALPDVTLKCYTASEIHHMTTLQRPDARAGAARAQGCRSRRADGRRRRGLRRSRPSPRRARARSTRTSGSTSTTPLTSWGSRPTALSSTDMSRPTRSGSSTSSGSATSRTRRAASSRSSRSRSIPRTPSSSAAASRSRPAPPT